MIMDVLNEFFEYFVSLPAGNGKCPVQSVLGSYVDFVAKNHKKVIYLFQIVHKDSKMVEMGDLNMSKIVCRCGNILPDNTDRIGYKGYIISDREYFDMLDLADEMIESGNPCKEELAMAFRENVGTGDTYIRCKEVYQCPLCGRVIMENTPGRFCFFAPEGNDEKNLLDYGAGDKIKYTYNKEKTDK